MARRAVSGGQRARSDWRVPALAAFAVGAVVVLLRRGSWQSTGELATAMAGGAGGGGDPYVLGLESGQPTAVYGLVLVASWPHPPEHRAQYEDLARRLAEADPALYVYPYSSLHITVATLASFKLSVLRGASADCRHWVLSAWRAELGRVFGEGLPARPFELDAMAPVFGADVGTLRYRERRGRQVAGVRELVGHAFAGLQASFAETGAAQCAGDPLVTAASLRDGFRIPDIIHSTVYRRGRQLPTAGGEAGRDRAEAAQAHERVRAVAREWVPFGLRVETLRLVVEDRPYMHIPAEPEHILEAF